MKLSILLYAVLFTIFGLVHLHSHADDEGENQKQTEVVSTPDTTSQNLLEVLQASDRFSSFIIAAGAAGILDELERDEDMTILVPTNEALEKLIAGTSHPLDGISNRAMLKSAMSYLVINGTRLERDLTHRMTLQASNGQRHYLNHDGGRLKINQANVIEHDIRASNGVIHVIDQVLLPSDLTTLCVPVGDQERRFTTLIQLVRMSGRIEGVIGSRAHTVFIPTNRAFEDLPKGMLEELMLPENQAKLTELLSNHFVVGRIYSDTAVTIQEVTTANGSRLRFDSNDSSFNVDMAKVMEKDIETRTGVVHVIDRVLIPAGFKLD